MVAGKIESYVGQSQCTYRCVVLPDVILLSARVLSTEQSQCTYRCVVLPDVILGKKGLKPASLNAPTGAWCSLTGRVGRRLDTYMYRLNAPTGA